MTMKEVMVGPYVNHNRSSKTKEKRDINNKK